MKHFTTRILSFFVLVCSLASMGMLHAESLTIADAKNAATDFFLSGNSNGLAKAKMRSGQYLTLAADNQNGYYIFNRQDGGIVIVADDDALGRTVLGYTTEGEYDPENLPVGLQDWFSQITVLMDAVHAGKIDRRESLSMQQGNIVVDALIKTKWNQYEPYNYLCPLVDGQRCLTGCVATAMAQVLYYWRWPEHGYGSVEYTASDINQNLSLDLSKNYYDWSNMLEEYKHKWDNNLQKSVLDCTDQQANAVATLMRDCGYSVHMNYGLGASGAAVSAQTLMKYFKYSPLAEDIYRGSYPDKEWHQMLQNELDNKRPILYSGASEEGGHQFILDGYDTEDYYHVNWGWGGYQDGWFILTDLNDFNTGQGAIIGVEPIKNLIPDYKDEAFTYTLSNGVLTIKGSGMMTDDYALDRAPWKDHCHEIKKIVIGEGIISTARNFGSYYSETEQRSIFYDNLQEVVLPEGLLFIDYGFLDNSPIQNIKLPSTLKIVNNGFGYCQNIQTLHLPKNIKKFECYGLYGLTEITVDAANPYFTAIDNVLLNKEGTKMLLSAYSRQRLVIPETVTEVSSYAINNSSASVIVAKPMNAPAAPEYGFYLPKQTGIFYIKEGATGYDNWLSMLPEGWILKTYTDESQIPTGEFSWSLKDGVLAINGSGVMPEEYSLETAPWRDHCQEIKKIIIGDGILSTPYRFGFYSDYNANRSYYFENLEEVVLPEGMLFIEDYFAYSCPLQKINLPSSLQRLHYGIVYCTKLKSLHLPKSLKDFQCNGLTGLAEITVDEANPYFMAKDNVLLNKEGTMLIQAACAIDRLIIPETVTEIYQSALYNNQASTIIAKPMVAPKLSDWGIYFQKYTGLFYMQEGATGYEEWLSRLPEGWTAMTYTDESQIPTGEFSWTLEDGVLTINGSGMMPEEYKLETAPWKEQCQDIKKIIIGEGILNTVSSFGYGGYNSVDGKSYLFENLEEVVLPEGLLTLADNFVNFAPIKRINLPSTLQRINNTFWYCGEITSLHLPKGLKEISGNMLTGLSEITIDPENPNFIVKDNVLLNKEGTEVILAASASNKIQIPETTTGVSTYAIYNNQASIIVARSMTAPALPDWGFSMQKQYGILYIKEGATGYEEWLSKLPEGWIIKTYTNENQIPSNEFSWTLEEGILTISGLGELPYSYSDRPFADYSSEIAKIKIEDGVMNLGWATFWGFYATSEIELPSTMRTVESQSFGYSGINKIVCLAKTAPQVSRFVNMQETGVLQVLKGCDYSSWLAALPSGWTIEEIEHPLIGKIDNLKNYLLEINTEGVNAKELDANKDGKLSVSDITEMARQLSE